MFSSSCRSVLTVPRRGVRSLAPRTPGFRPPWFYVKKGNKGLRKIGPIYVERHKFPGQQREFDEIPSTLLIDNKLGLPSKRNRSPIPSKAIGDAEIGETEKIPEMQPELVVPDLTGFKLRPYVSYRTDVLIESRRRAYMQMVRTKGSEQLADLHTSPEQRWPPPKITAETLFDLYYAPLVRQAYKSGKYDDFLRDQGLIDESSKTKPDKSEDNN